MKEDKNILWNISLLPSQKEQIVLHSDDEPNFQKFEESVHHFLSVISEKEKNITKFNFI